MRELVAERGDLSDMFTGLQQEIWLRSVFPKKISPRDDPHFNNISWNYLYSIVIEAARYILYTSLLPNYLAI